MNKAIITGATGAIGLALIEELVNMKIEVMAVCHRGSRRIERILKSPLVRIVECNMDEVLEILPNMLESKGCDYDVCYHLAWGCTYGDSRNNIDAQMDNIRYTLAMVETASKLGCKRFIGVGSQAEYGRVEGRISGTTSTFPESGYGIAKLCAGQLSRLRCEQLGMEHIWARVLSVYGPGDLDKTMIMSLIRRLLAGEKTACTKGEQIWDYLYSKDAAKAFYLLGMQQNKKLEPIYCIGSGKGRKLSEYICAIRDALAPDAEIGFGDISYAAKQVMYLEADISDLTRDTGFVPVYSFEEGIQETIAWARKNCCIN